MAARLLHLTQPPTQTPPPPLGGGGLTCNIRSLFGVVNFKIIWLRCSSSCKAGQRGPDFSCPHQAFLALLTMAPQAHLYFSISQQQPLCQQKITAAFPLTQS